jgi:hypothetical protein
LQRGSPFFDFFLTRALIEKVQKKLMLKGSKSIKMHKKIFLSSKKNCHKKQIKEKNLKRLKDK